MFPYSDPTTTLELHRQKVDELIRAAADRQQARNASEAAPRRRFGPWRGRRNRGRHVAATA